MGRPVKLIIQIPCLNEEDQLPLAVADLPRTVEGCDVVLHCACQTDPA